MTINFKCIIDDDDDHTFTCMTVYRNYVTLLYDTHAHTERQCVFVGDGSGDDYDQLEFDEEEEEHRCVLCVD